MRWLSILMLMCCFSGSGIADHGDLDRRIRELSVQIKQFPDSGKLYLSRGMLHHQHEDFDAALADFLTAQKLVPELEEVDLRLGMLLVDYAQPLSALFYLNPFLNAQEDHVVALKTRAKAFVQLGQDSLAVQDLRSVLQILTKPRPENYLALANVLAGELWKGNQSVKASVDSIANEQPDLCATRMRSQAGKAGSGDSRPPDRDTIDKAARINAALTILDEGMGRLGPLVTLQLPAIRLEVSLLNFKGAIRRVDGLIASVSRNEQYWLQKAEISYQAGWLPLAWGCTRRAAEGIEKLPAHFRRTQLVQGYLKRIQGLEACLREEQGALLVQGLEHLGFPVVLSTLSPRMESAIQNIKKAASYP